MSNSIRGTQHGKDAPFVMHLERVCQLIEMDQTFIVEFNPNSDIAHSGMLIVRGVRLRIHEGGDIGNTILKDRNGPIWLDELDPNRGKIANEIMDECDIFCMMHV